MHLTCNEEIGGSNPSIGSMNSKKQIRNDFRISVYKRDNHTCKVCNTKRESEELDAHHITDRNEMPNGGYVTSNGITVCQEKCHMIVEQYHISGGENWNDGYHPSDLYELIGSSKELAVKESLKL